MARSSLREKIIEAGVITFHQRGYAATGVREITQAAGAPLGSFSNHFRSKEAFALVVLDRYLDRLQATMAATLRDEGLMPVDRLHAYFNLIGRVAEETGWRFGCMVPNMALEMPEHSEPIRRRLSEAMAALTEPLADVVRAAQAAGQVRADCAPDDLATFVLASWHGSLLRAKVERGSRPLDVFRRTLFALLAPAGAQPPDLSREETQPNT